MTPWYIITLKKIILYKYVNVQWFHTAYAVGNCGFPQALSCSGDVSASWGAWYSGGTPELFHRNAASACLVEWCLKSGGR